MHSQLGKEIVDALYPVKAHELPEVCSELGLAAGSAEEAFQSKKRYVTERVKGLNEVELITLGGSILPRYPTYGLDEAMEAVRPSVGYKIDEVTRRAVILVFEQLGNINGRLGWVDFLNRVWPLKEIKVAAVDILDGCATAEDSVQRHMTGSKDWTVTDLFEFLGVRHASDKRFGKCIELVVSPLVRDESDQKQYAERISTALSRIGFELRAIEEQSGYPVYRLVPIVGGVSGTAKNLIFAANGPKPELVLADAVNNDIKIVKNEEFCLVFDAPIPNRGLLWTDLVDWWAKRSGTNPDDRATEVALYKRLVQSLASPPEKVLFEAYFRRFKNMGDRLPALVPQVYLHYDPYVQNRLAPNRRLPRQRMDFLMILSHLHRVVIEVDGKQHYADQDRASPAKYGEMVCADRDLKLAGYEVFRFGGAELNGATGEATAAAFFKQLFEKYQRA